MMWFAAAIGSALLFGLAGWWMKVSQMQRGSSVFLLLGLYISGTIGFGIHAWAEGSLPGSLADWRVWLWGILIGAGSAWGNALFMKALECGPASLTSPLTNMNIVLVIALGTFVYGEPFQGAEMIGVALLVTAVVFISIRGKEQLTIKHAGWYGLVAASIVLFAVRNGGLKITDDLGLSGASVLFLSYALSILWFAAAASRERKGNRLFIEGGTARRAEAVGLRWGLVAGLFSYGGLQLYAVALQTGQANIVGPIFAANSLVVALGSILLYRERLTRLQWIAFLLTIAGLILIRL